MIKLLVITLIGLCFRLILINQSFWLDEGASLVLANLPTKTYLSVAGGDFHPPLFYLLLKIWLPVAGHNEWLLRLPNVIFGTLSIPIFFYLLKTISPKNNLALFGSLLLAINPLHVYYSQELRMYSMHAFLIILSWFFLVKNRPFFWTIVNTIGLYTFYGTIFNLFAQAVYIVWLKKNLLTTLILSYFVLFVLYLPWLPILFKQLSGGGYLTTALPTWSLLSGNLSLKSLGLIITKFYLGRISFLNKDLYLFVVACLFLYFLGLLFLSLKQKSAKIFLLWFIAPLIMAVILSFKTPLLGYWRFIYLLPAFIAIQAAALNSSSPKSNYINLIVLVFISILSNIYFWRSPSFHREDWQSLGRLINNPKSITLVSFPDGFAPMKFYSPTATIYPLQSKLGLNRDDWDLSLISSLSKFENIYVLDYLMDLTDSKRQILGWLRESGYKENQSFSFNGLGQIYQFSLK